MTGEDVLEVVREALAVVCERPVSALARATPLAEVGADSLARVELAEQVEQRVADRLPGLHIGDDALAAFVTVGDVADFVTERL